RNHILRRNKFCVQPVYDTMSWGSDCGRGLMNTSDIQGTFDSFLTALGDLEGGDALYRMHASDAIVRHPEGVGPLAAMSRDEFASAHRELNLQGREALPQFGPGNLVRESAAGPEVVAWFEVIETREQRPLLVALGLKSVEDAWRIGWCTL